MIMRFKTSRGFLNIKPVVINKETTKSVIIRGRRRLKLSEWDSYHATWQDAKDFLIKEAEAKVKRWQSQLSEAENYLIKVKGIEKEAGPL